MERDDWLSEQLGKTVYKVDSQEIPFKYSTGCMYYCKSTDPNVGSWFFDFITTEIIMMRVITPQIIKENKRKVLNFCEEKNEIDYCLSIAKKAFSYDRFHLDSNTRLAANTLKKNWLRNCFSGNRGDSVLVHEEGGFLCSLILENYPKKIAVIDLIAVDPNKRKRGIGFDLINSFFARYPNHIYQVSTQLNNLPSLALYQKCGFKIIGYNYIFHKHT